LIASLVGHWHAGSADDLKRRRGSLEALGLGPLGPAHEDSLDFALRLLLWLLIHDLLPAALIDPEPDFRVSGVRFLELRTGSDEAQEIGPARLRRLLPIQRVLPTLSASWLAAMQPATTLAPAPQSARGPLRVRLEGIPEPLRARCADRLRQVGVEPVLGMTEDSDDVLPWIVDSDAPDTRVAWGERPTTLDGWLPPEDAVRRLPGVALERASRAWRAETPPRTRVVVSTYGPTEGSDGPIALRLWEPLEDKPTGEARQAAMSHLWEGLQQIRPNLSDLGAPVRLVPRCTPAAVGLLGMALHETWAQRLLCWQNDGWWDLGVPPALGDHARLKIDAQPDATELHLLVSASQVTDDDYGRWRRTQPAPAVVIRAVPSIGTPGKEAIPSAAVARAWTRQLLAAVRDHRPLLPSGRAPIRVFIAAPNALTLALGRSFNAMGRVIWMDRLKDPPVYVETATIDV